MALTIDEKKHYEDVIARTGTLRSSFKSRTIPEWYTDYLKKVQSEEIYVPTEYGDVRCVVTRALDKQKNCPLHINMHGGGFYFPQNGDDDMYCAHLAAEIHGVVVDIDYALSQDKPFPAAFEQCYAVCGWAFGKAVEWGCDASRVSIGGHSAGGNLTAAITLRAGCSGDYKFCLQVVDFAALNMDKQPVDDAAADAMTISAERSNAFFSLYTDGDDNLTNSPCVSPIKATDEMLKKAPPTLIISAGKCGFRFDNESLGLRLAALGVEVTMRRFVNSRHGFTVRLVDEWEAAQQLVIDTINRIPAQTEGEV
ncbi:MAG: alpha/beta hydrolase fold domain-containing protein [Candidatus Heteroscillospira sp.]|jgi:acetyl esterase